MNADVKTANNEHSLTAELRRRMNIVLIRIADLEVEDKEVDEISLTDIVGNMDAMGYLIVFLSLVVTLTVAFLSGMLVLRIWPKPSAFLVLAALPGVLAGFGSSYVLFRLRRWLKLNL